MSTYAIRLARFPRTRSWPEAWCQTRVRARAVWAMVRSFSPLLLLLLCLACLPFLLWRTLSCCVVTVVVDSGCREKTSDDQYANSVPHARVCHARKPRNLRPAWPVCRSLRPQVHSPQITDRSSKPIPSVVIAMRYVHQRASSPDSCTVNTRLSPSRNSTSLKSANSRSGRSRRVPCLFSSRLSATTARCSSH